MFSILDASRRFSFGTTSYVGKYSLNWIVCASCVRTITLSNAIYILSNQLTLQFLLQSFSFSSARSVCLLSTLPSRIALNMKKKTVKHVGSKQSSPTVSLLHIFRFRSFDSQLGYRHFRINIRYHLDSSQDICRFSACPSIR